MELSEEVNSLLQRYKILHKQNEGDLYDNKLPSLLNSDVVNDVDLLIHQINEMSFNDETWLYECPEREKPTVINLHDWLHEDFLVVKGEEFHVQNLHLVRELARIDTKKLFDTRTFTRPKKRFNRPSIEKYKEEIFDTDVRNDDEIITTKLDEKDTNKKSDIQEDNIICEGILVHKPLMFDLSQPTSSNIFDKIVVSTGELDSFQNISPPSLVNSMCSSTFTNLMENSYIKNDPELREICNTDYSDKLLLQDNETPMFHSFIKNCTSLNSETYENNLKKSSLPSDLIVKKSLKNCDGTSSLDTSIVNTTPNTINVDKHQDILNGESFDVSNHFPHDSPEDLLENIDTNITIVLTPNRTFNEKPDFDMNLKTPSCCDNLNKLDTPSQMLNLQSDNSSENCVLDNNSAVFNNSTNFENVYNYVSDPKDSNIGYNNMNCTVIKNKLIDSSTGSLVSLDHVSMLSSSSSKDSNKMLNVSEVDAIVEQQEQSLQVMSTPKQNNAVKKLWDNHFVSPITKNEYLSDSEDEYATVKSSLSKGSSSELDQDTLITDDNKVNQEQLAQKNNPRSVNTITGPRIPQSLQLTSSCTNLKTVGENFKSSYGSLHNIGKSLKGSYSNLKTLKFNLRGSYTSLKSASTNLPIAPPPLSQKSAANAIFKKPMDMNSTKVIEVPFSHKGKDVCSKQIKTSGLPRPIVSVCTGIPRPVSKIPGPRTVRSATSRPDVRIGNS